MVWQSRIGTYAAVALLAVAAAAADPAADPVANDHPQDFAPLSLRFIAEYLEHHPVRATALGVHDHDTRLPDWSRRGVKRRVRWLGRWQDRFAAVDATALDRDASFDLRILDNAIRAELLALRETREWRHSPMHYTRVMAESVALLVDRQFAPLEQRLDAIVARLDGFVKLIAAARANLERVPPEWSELTLRGVRGAIEFLETGLPAALAEQGLEELDDRRRLRWDKSSERALRTLDRYFVWLETELLPHANGDYRLGRETFERKLRHEEHFELDVVELGAMNEAAIERYRGWVHEVAAELDPEASTEAAMQRVTGDFPPADRLIDTARECVERARRLVVDRELVTLPEQPLPIVRPTPEFARSGFASMSAPGPFESGATEAYYNVTNVDPDWTEEQQREHLTYFNHAGLLGISVHEVMPGHWVQLLAQRELPTDVRKVFAPSSLVEGWAHYAEQLMVDEGLGDGDPAIRLGQLRRALQRHARWYAGLALHTEDVSLDRAAERFAEIAFFAPFPARRETLRATYDPTYLYYALGRMQILELRDDYRRMKQERGEPFTLREFHDRFLELGLPIPLAREALLDGGANP